MYDATTVEEITYAKSLNDPTEDKFHGSYDAILHTFFNTASGYIVEHQVMGPGGKPEFIIVRRGGTPSQRNPVIIVELKRPSKWNAAGKQEVLNDLTQYIEGRLDHTSYSKIYGIGAIGFHWMTCEMPKTGPHVPTVINNWHDDITTAAGYALLHTFANTVHNIS
ncbi:hypothetical protein BD410DRAFT_452019 [Rickenella mellea]|uniref:Fungal-type protein kinase domain-containing protein n=1 Tax=Rickenella mellea TaxID=50990 RepID=A0A4Y7PVA4_9AGAM|nr:hypothetical protein BD410DRAFT_452019 [Rickenella mellea]